MKVVINKCYGGFSLSRAAVKRMAELQGRECHFFTTDYQNADRYVQAENVEPGGRDMFSVAFDIPNPNEVLHDSREWRDMTLEERRAADTLHEKHCITNRPDDRADPVLVKVVEELGEAANGSFAKLEIVEIPDGVIWEIEEYDGMEHVAERHRTWG